MSMDEEERKMLERVLAISEQTNRVVRRMRHEELLMRFFHVFYWIVILGIAYLGYYFIKPYLGNVDLLLQNLDKIQIPK
jgi:hypothetical protein